METRKKKELTQIELANLAGLERPSIALIEAGRQKLPIDRLFKIAIALDTPLSTFLPSLEDVKQDLSTSAEGQRQITTPLGQGFNSQMEKQLQEFFKTPKIAKKKKG